MAKEVQEGTFKGGIILKGMDNGSIDFVINPKLADKVPDKVKADIEKAKADIKSGKLVVPKDEF